MRNLDIQEFSQSTLEEQELDITYQWLEEQERARKATTIKEVERAKLYGLEDLIPVFEEDFNNW